MGAQNRYRTFELYIAFLTVGANKQAREAKEQVKGSAVFDGHVALV
jgi:hypothetical protein